MENKVNEHSAIATFSLKISDLPILNKIEKLGDLEGKSRSAMIVTAIQEYLHHHDPPNFQPTLDHAVNIGMSVKSSSVCCVGECKRKAKHRLVLKDYEGKTETFNVCDLHKRWRHKVFNQVVGHKQI